MKRKKKKKEEGCAFIHSLPPNALWVELKIIITRHVLLCIPHGKIDN